MRGDEDIDGKESLIDTYQRQKSRIWIIIFSFSAVMAFSMFNMSALQKGDYSIGKVIEIKQVPKVGMKKIIYEFHIGDSIHRSSENVSEKLDISLGELFCVRYSPKYKWFSEISLENKIQFYDFENKQFLLKNLTVVETCKDCFYTKKRKTD